MIMVYNRECAIQQVYVLQTLLAGMKPHIWPDRQGCTCSQHYTAVHTAGTVAIKGWVIVHKIIAMVQQSDH